MKLEYFLYDVGYIGDMMSMLKFGNYSAFSDEMLKWKIAYITVLFGYKYSAQLDGLEESWTLDIDIN